MAASITDQFNKYSNGSQALPTQLSAQKLAGATTASLSSATGWDTTTAKYVRMYNTTVSGSQTIPDQSTISFYKATLSGTTLSNLTLIWSATGSDQTYAAGTTVDLAVMPGYTDDLATGLLVSHDQDGTLKAGAVDVTAVVADSVITNAKLVADTVAQDKLHEKTSEYLYDFIASGGVIVQTAGLTGSFSNIVYYISGVRYTKSSIPNKTYTASKDTYVDIDTAGTITYTEVANNAASPALAANNIRVGIVITSGAAITSVNQGEENKVLPIASSIPYAVTDSLGNLICPRDPFRKLLGYRQRVSGTFSTTSTTAVQVTELSCPVIVPTGRKIKVSVAGQDQYSSGAGVINSQLSIWDGTVGSGTQIGGNLAQQNAAASTVVPYAEAIVTPATTSKTYNAGLKTSNAANAANLDSTSATPLYIKVELV